MPPLKSNFTIELAELLEFTAKVAIAIRRNTPYNSAYNAKNPDHANDVMWLAECLHNFDMLAQAIRESRPESIVSACDMLISMYEEYGEEGSDQKAAFYRHRAHFQLENAIAVFQRIKIQAQIFLVEECTV